MILETPLSHFNSDIERCRTLYEHGCEQPGGMLRDDILRTSWMFAIGATDAFFCDAYGDLIARTFRAKLREPGVALPKKLNDLKVPATVVLTKHLQNGWLWRNIARDLIEKDNVLSLDKVQTLFNQFLSKSNKFLSQDANSAFDKWIQGPQSKPRLFGVTRATYIGASSQARTPLRKDAVEAFKERFDLLFQRRHDCIHNCDRPKVAPQSISVGSVQKTIADTEFLVRNSHALFVEEFPKFLKDLGFSAITRNYVGCPAIVP